MGCIILWKKYNIVGCIYRPNDFRDMVEIEKVKSSARGYVDKRDFQDLIIMGDFNFLKLCWSNGSVSSIKSDNGIKYDFVDTLNENYLYQHVNIPTL